MKTNAMRELDKHKIIYEVLEFEINEHHLDGMTVANHVLKNPDEVFKTLVVCDKDMIFVCLIPVDARIDLKKLSKACGRKTLSMLPLSQLTQKTGYQRGGCSPIGMKKLFPTFIHESCLNHETIVVSGGRRGCQLVVSPQTLIELLTITVGYFTQ